MGKVVPRDKGRGSVASFEARSCSSWPPAAASGDVGGLGPEMEFTVFSPPRVSASHPPPRQPTALRAVCVTPTGEVETVVLLPTDHSWR
jgi:hypothetical protein